MINNLYPSDKIIAPVNNPIKPRRMKPPIAPIKIISMGTGAPLPIKMGLR